MSIDAESEADRQACIDQLVESERALNAESVRVAFDVARSCRPEQALETFRRFEQLLAKLFAAARQRGVLEGIEKHETIVRELIDGRDPQ